MMCIFAARGSDITLKKNLGSIIFADHTKTIFYDINLHSYYEQIDKLNVLLKNLTVVCSELPKETSCDSHISNFQLNLNNMNKNAELLRMYHLQRNRRFVQLLAMGATRAASQIGTRMFLMTATTSLATGLAATYFLEDDEGKQKKMLLDVMTKQLQDSSTDFSKQLKIQLETYEYDQGLHLKYMKYQE